MNVIRTTKYAMLRRLLWSVVLVILCALPVIVLADTPPQALTEHISSKQLVYAKKCNVDFLGLKHVECLIYYDAERDTAWIVLYNDKLVITHIAVNQKGKETLVWCHQRICV